MHHQNKYHVHSTRGTTTTAGHYTLRTLSRRMFTRHNQDRYPRGTPSIPNTQSPCGVPRVAETPLKNQ
ncbi:hypothetical protein E2C01_006753 [Portunus trituberculatus]|uniref:Uncharacterized protein n=1 Tax=Portunus trituberculatus TaxID=210409 RepID=A0A5B7CX61_PORTR|nr:hypothetical protein [Portunus trituberculatus]